jgi:hypothetical protein
MNPLQRAALRRKVYYFAVILVLFTVSMLWRGIIPIPLSDLQRVPTNVAQRGANWLAGRSILNQSYALDLRELERGDPELAGEGARLMLTGSRGFAVAYLWHSAIEAQKRNDFHKMEKRIGAVVSLQPHFITPWIFQSWNIAYNVSVEMHGSGDMYYYIARGIELLAEGERRNSHTVRDPSGGERKLGSPDIRYQIAFYYQNKFGVSDQVEVLRCLFQLSCIPEAERNPDDLIDPVTGAVDLKAFRRFCEKHPHLVRRLRGEDRKAEGFDDRTRQRIREALKCPTPESIVQFLRDNRQVPTRYKNAREFHEPDKQFPALPPQFAEGPNEVNPGSPTDDDFSAYKAARAWFTYSCVPLPPNPRDWEGKPMPWRTPYADEYNQLLYRVPRQPLMIIFRQGPPRVQSFQAEMEQKEGWFDAEGWRIDDPTDQQTQNWWFPDPDTRPGEQPRPLDVVVGRERAWSLEEWNRARDMWHHHRDEYGLELSEDRINRYRARVTAAGGLSGVPPEEIAAEREKYASALQYLEQNRRVTNFAYFLASATGEAKRETVQARKTLWHAEQARKLGNKQLATRLYIDGLNQWKAVLAGDRNFHRPEGSERIEEQSYEYEIEYLRMLVQDDQRVRERANAVVSPVRGVVPFLTYPYPETLRQSQLAANERAQEAAPSFLRAFMPTPYPRVLTRAQAAVNRKLERLRAGAPNFLRPFIPLPFARGEDDPPTQTPQWSKDAQEEIKWYVAEREFSPFSQLMDTPDDRRGTPWVRNEVKTIVRVTLGIERRKDLAMQQGEPGAPTSPSKQ